MVISKQSDRLLASVDLDIGGEVNIPELEPEEIPDEPGDVRVLETDDPQGYITVHERSGNNQDTYEFCFRVRGNVAALTTLTRMEDGKDCNCYWISDEIKEAIKHHHPELTVVNTH